MNARLGGHRRKKDQRLGSLIRRELKLLGRLSAILNQEPQPLVSAEDRRVVEEIVDHARSLRSSRLREKETQAFNRLAARAPIAFEAGALTFMARAKLNPADPATYRWGASRAFALGDRLGPAESSVFVKSPSPLGAVVLLLVQFLEHPRRDRLRQCPRCSKWFVDRTKNKSALRCSRRCTIAWSNSRRSRKGDRRSPTARAS